MNKANSATTANNANMLSSHPYSSILSRQNTYSEHLNASGWYRAAATTGPTNSYGRTGFLILEQDYTHSYPESYVFAITASYAGNYDITQLVGTRSGGEFTKIRLLLKNNNIAYVDFWYSVSRPCIANVITFPHFPSKSPLNPSPLPLLTNPPTPASLSWNSPTLGHQTFSGPRASPPIDFQQGHPLLHMLLEPWVPLCVLFGWWFGY